MPYSAWSQNPVCLESVAAHLLYAIPVCREPDLTYVVIGLPGCVYEEVTGIVVECPAETAKSIFALAAWKQKRERVDEIADYVCNQFHLFSLS